MYDRKYTLTSTEVLVANPQEEFFSVSDLHQLFVRCMIWDVIKEAVIYVLAEFVR